MLTDTTVLKEIAREDASKNQRKKQPEPAPEESPKIEETPVAGAPRERSSLATKGFF